LHFIAALSYALELIQPTIQYHKFTTITCRKENIKVKESENINQAFHLRYYDIYD
jgi:hypothetical protein